MLATWARIEGSRCESGANALSEAIANRTAVLATAIEGTIGLVGDRYPGLFAVGDAKELANRIERARTEPEFLAALQFACEPIRERLSPEHERDGWKSLISSLFPGERSTRSTLSA